MCVKNAQTSTTILQMIVRNHENYGNEDQLPTFAPRRLNEATRAKESVFKSSGLVPILPEPCEYSRTIQSDLLPLPKIKYAT